MKLEKEYYELQQYSRRNNVETLVLLDIFTRDRLTGKAVDLCIEVRDIEVCHRPFQKESNYQLPKRSIVSFVNGQFAQDLPSKQNISSTLDFNKLGFARVTQIYIISN